MISKYENPIQIKTTLSGKNYYSTLIPSTIPEDVFQFSVISRNGDRFDTLAYRYYNDASKWWIIAKANNLVNGSIFIPPGTKLIIPSAGL
jgi:nucleoid-associated protein YgaU